MATFTTLRNAVEVFPSRHS